MEVYVNTYIYIYFLFFFMYKIYNGDIGDRQAYPTHCRP